MSAELAGAEVGNLDFDPFAGGELQRVVPATPPQVEIWLADRLAQEASLAYNESESFIFEGQLNKRALSDALNDLIQRHDALRSTLGPDGQSLCFSESALLTIQSHDLCDLEGQAQSARVHDFTTQAVETPFSLEHGPMLRATLLRLGLTRHQLILTVHHAVCDGWSWGVLKRELALLYSNHVRGTHPAVGLPTPPSFAQYAERIAQQADGDQAKNDMSFWKSVYATDVPVMELPLDRPRPALRTFRAGFLVHALDAALMAQVKRTAARAGASLFSTLLAGFAIVMGRLSSQSDVVVGVAAAGQTLDGNDDMVGHAVSMLPMRLSWNDSDTFATVVQRSQAHVFDAMEHQRLTYGDLLRVLNVPRDPSRLPLVSVLFNIDTPIPAAQMQFAGLETRTHTNPRSFENYELFVNAVETDAGLVLQAQFNADLFDSATVLRWLGGFEVFLRGVATSLERPVRDGSMMTPADTALLERWNGTEVPYETGLRLGDLIQRGVQSHPTAVAVRFEGRNVSYAELDSMAWGLAHKLRGLGVKPGDLVGICLERSVELVAALVGVIYSGGAYVPLDPSYPSERLTHMCEDAHMNVIVTRGPELALAGSAFASGIQLVRMDEAWVGVPTPAGKLVGAPEDPAYVIFTSGSTGRPKGAMNAHQGIVNRLQWTQQEYQLTPQDRVMQKTPYSFDVSVWEFFWPLMTGATIIVARPDGHRDPGYIAQLIQDEAVSLLHFVPSMLRLFLEEPRGAQCRSVRQVLCSGEALPIDVVDRFFESIGHARLGNLYGPTEAAVDVTFWNCAPGDLRRIVPIGRPVANTRMYVLDAQLRQVPIGQTGELFIGGVQVGMGYVSRPDLSAERFVPDPFNPGGRMYRTGDVARWLNDGAIDYLGRADQQVKIRGNRIELGEIELALGSHASVSHVVVIAREDAPGDTRLVAYMVAAGAPVAGGELQARLRSSLPEYMVPQQFVWLPEIPLLPNGKINRKALPAPGIESQVQAREIRLPNTSTEIVLADLWRRLLHVEQIGTEDNFIALGGHSLLLMRMASQIKSKLGLALPVREYFVAPTLADLARRIDALAAPKTQAVTSRIRAREQQGDAPLSLMQERLWFMESLHPGRVIYHIDGGMRLRGRLDEVALAGAVQALLCRQSALRTVFVGTGSDPVMQRVLPELKLPLLPAEDLSTLPAAQKESRLVARIGELGNRAFQLRGAPLVRMHLFKIASDEHVLFLMVHHLVFDGWSMTVLLRELAELYSAHKAGATPQLPALPLSYGDFAVWHRDWTQSEAARSQVSHWRNKLQGLDEPLALQTDFPRPPQPSNLAGAVQLHVPRALADALKAVGQSEDATLFMTALAGYYALLHRHTGQTDFVVGFPVRGRNDAELEDLIGYFANVLPLRLSVLPNQTFREVLRNTRQAVLEAFDNADAPFEQVVRELNLPRDESRFPVYQTMFAFQDTRGTVTKWGDLQATPLPETVDAVAEDLAVWMVEQSDGLSAKLTYASDLFAAESIELLAQRYVRLLEEAARMPDQTVGALPILLDRELAQLRSWNATDRPLDASASLSTLLQDRMRQHADSFAVVFGTQTWRTCELHTRANRLAHLLRAKGIGRGALVGLCLERSPQMLAAQLAVLWSGAAYVPLDPAYPIDRLTHMAEDADLALVLTDLASRQSLSWRPERTVCLEDEAGAIADQPDVPLSVSDALAARAQDPAYVIYTSGSTGKPKGVTVPHGAVVNFLTSMADRPGMTHGDRILAVTTISFDIAVLELLLPLSVGACILLATRDQTMDGNSLRDLLEKGNATMVQATPSTWRLLLAAGWNGNPHFKALTGGEALPVDLAQELSSRCGELWNMYGPTETTVWSTCCRIEPQVGRIDIGKPIANTQVHVLDSQQCLCPIGVPGEIHIAGAGVALGYLNRPELSAERFVPDPFVPAGNRYMYRTGDLGRWLANGSLEHLGRLDHQVKVRGHRIELGEIEACLATYGAVSNSVVVVSKDIAGTDRIAAYLVARQAPTTIADLKTHLRAFLPEYMLPQVFVWLPAIPLLPNGKIDRKALPAPTEVNLARNQVTEALSTPNEVAIATIWSNILGISGIRASDNFFDLGGYSLLAMQALAEMHARLGTKYELRQLIFESLGSIAAMIPSDSTVSIDSLQRVGLVNRLASGIKSKILGIRS